MDLGTEKFEAFSGDSIASTFYAYSSWIPSNYEHVELSFKCATVDAAITIRVEGRYNSSSRTASVHCESVAAAQTIDKVVSLSHYIPYMRVGAKVDTAASPGNLYADLLMFDER